MSIMLTCTFCPAIFHSYAEWYEHEMKHIIGEANLTMAKLYKSLIEKPIYQMVN